MEEEKKVDESTEKKADESADRKPSEYEIKLRRENEKLRKDLQAKLDAEQKAKEDALAEQGKWKELYEKLKPEHDKLASDNATLNNKLESIENETRKELLLRFPEGKRDVLKDLPIEKLRELAKHEATGKPGVDTGTGVKHGSGTKTKPTTLQAWKQQFLS
jgi:hypothetical protein